MNKKHKYNSKCKCDDCFIEKARRRMKWDIWVLPLVLLLLIFLFIGRPMIDSYSLDKWCEEEGFDEGYYTTGVEKNCIEIEGNIMIKTEVDRCKKGWCFVK